MNQQNQSEDDKPTAALADLAVPAEHAEQTKAGETVYTRHEGAFMGNLFSATPVANDLEPHTTIKGGSLPTTHQATDVTLKRGIIG